MATHDPHELDAEAYTLEARAAELHARASRLRASQQTTMTTSDWIPIGELPLAKKSARALAKSGAFETKAVRGRLYALRPSFDAFMSDRDDKPANVTGDDTLRAELGLVSGGRR